MHLPELHTLKETAEEKLRISRPTLHGLIRSGDLRTVTIGRRRFVTDAEIVRFISEHEK